MTTGTEPAFPIAETDNTQSIALGLTIREHFAAMAMIGLLMRKDDLHTAETVAQKAVLQADALIVELNKTN